MFKFSAIVLLGSVLGLASVASAAPRVGSRGHPYDPSYQRGSIEGFSEVSSTAGGAGVQTATYRSPAMSLLPGQVVFTDPNATPLSFPKGEVALVSFDAQIVDENGTPVPLSEVYLHHWLIFDGYGNSGICGGYLGYKFGVGAESRRTVTQFPDGFGLVTTGREQWGANIHILRTDGVPDVKSCIECHCPGGGGNFGCCPDGSFCDTTPGITRSPKTYYLEYTLKYLEDASTVTPLDIYVLDVSNCAIEYDIPQCSAPPCVSTLGHELTLPHDMDVVFTVGHLHIGALNLTIEAESPGGSRGDFCNAFPTYGTGDKAGDEKGYVVEINTCSFPEVRKLEAGTVLRYNARYDSDPYHDGVMGLVYIAAISRGGKVLAASDPRLWFGHPGFVVAFVAVAIAAVAAVGAAVFAWRRIRTEPTGSHFRPLAA